MFKSIQTFIAMSFNCKLTSHNEKTTIQNCKMIRQFWESKSELWDINSQMWIFFFFKFTIHIFFSLSFFPPKFIFHNLWVIFANFEFRTGIINQCIAIRGSILRFSECIAILSGIDSELIVINSRWCSNQVFNGTLKCSRRRALVYTSHVLAIRLRMILWHELNVNTAYCENPCNYLQPFRTLWMIILGSSVRNCKQVQNWFQRELRCIHDASIYCPNHRVYISQLWVNIS